jgi:hypothetical protein
VGRLVAVSLIRGRFVGQAAQSLDQGLTNLLEAGQLHLLIRQNLIDLVEGMLLVSKLHLDIYESLFVHAAPWRCLALKYVFIYRHITCVHRNLQLTLRCPDAVPVAAVYACRSLTTLKPPITA